MSKRKDSTNEADIGAAMMAWYADSITNFPDGLISQAQAATILGISRVAVSRLINRDYIRAVYFPKPPDIIGISVGDDDPGWLKILGWLGMKIVPDTYAWPKAAYVSFGDVVKLWKSGEASKKSSRDWNEIVANILSDEERFERLKEIQATHKKVADAERKEKP